MRKFFLFSFLVSGLLQASIEPLKAASFRVGERVRNFEFTDLNGTKGNLVSFKSTKAIVVVMTKIGCPVAQKYLPRLKEIEASYKGKDVTFLLVHVGNNSLQEVKTFVKDFEISTRLTPDVGHEVARSLLVQTSTEAFVIDSKFTLRFRGAIDDQFGVGTALPQPKNHYLKDAIDAVLDNKEVEWKALTAPGCVVKVGEPFPDVAPTYHNRISRIFQNNCEQCHRPGEAGPFSLTNLNEVLNHLPMIEYTVQRNTMPPWFANPQNGHWLNDMSLTKRDKSALIEWTQQNAPEGDPEEAPLPKQWTEGWNIGTPDMEWAIPEAIEVPATGVVPYKYVYIDPKIQNDLWIESFEIRVDYPEVVHHVLVYTTTGTNPNSEENYLAARAPGNQWIKYPPHLGRKLRKGEKLIFQIHYAPNGKAVKDRPRLGVKFHKGIPQHEVLSGFIENTKFEIPPGNANYEVKAERTFTKPLKLLSFMPHMHLRGKAFRYELGDKTVLLDVPKYDFNWQLNYRFNVPLSIPAGEKIHTTAWYDNSEGNPNNPDPKATVKWGEQTFEEMMVGFYEYYEE